MPIMSISSGLLPSANQNGYGAVLFDLDGTLVDSLPALVTCLNTILTEDRRYKLTQDEVHDMVGDGIRALVRRAYMATGPSPANDKELDALVARFSAHYEPDPSLGCAPFAYVAEVITGLIGLGYKVGVVTNKNEKPARALLQRFSIHDIFDVIVGGDTTPYLKPHPEPFLHAADQLDISPQRVIMVGDSINDIEGARRAGMRSIAASYGYNQMPVEAFGADAVIDSLMDLPAAIQSLPQEVHISS